MSQLKSTDKNYSLTSTQFLSGLQATKYYIYKNVCHLLMTIKFRSAMNKTQKFFMMNMHKKCQQTSKKKIYMSLTVAETKMKMLTTIIMMRKAQVKNKLKYMKKKMIKKIERMDTLKKISLLKQDKLFIVTTRKIQTLMILKEKQIIMKTQTVTKI